MTTLGELVSGLVQIEPVHENIAISGISSDSRNIDAGSLFIALSGGNVDGSKFALKAQEQGAVGVLAANNAKLPDIDIPVLRVKKPRLVLSQMAARIFPRQPEIMVAVTGTAGKTSVAEFTRQIWSGCGRSAASIGTTGVNAPGKNDYGNLTTPDPVTLHRMLDELSADNVEAVALEASSHGLDQFRLSGVRLSAAGFTNLGRDHLDYHADIEEYFAAKMKLFTDLLKPGLPAVIFSDDPYSQRVIEIARNAGNKVLSVGRGGDFLTLKRVEHKRYSQIAEVLHHEKTYRINFPLAGDFQIANGLVAAGLAIATGTSVEDALAQLEHLEGASGRLELIGHNEFQAPVYVDYAHKPDALENVLKALRPFASNNLVVVFGCGGDRDHGKRAIMGEIASRLADKVIVTDDNPRSENPASIREMVLANAPNALEIGDRREAIASAISQLQEGDCLLIAGKGHEVGQIVGSEVLEFSDHAEARKVLGIKQ